MLNKGVVSNVEVEIEVVLMELVDGILLSEEGGELLFVDFGRRVESGGKLKLLSEWAMLILKPVSYSSQILTFTCSQIGRV